ncbi:hypothetical protein DRH14_00555 [Candidatus Shapirobacteria bacterium]|nr:MAG: hypothetical protein DRH14_00555 [Candidatus Shapirobacteria bacterium]
MGTYLEENDKMLKMKDGDIYKLFFNYLKKIFSDFDLKKVRQKHLFKLAKAQHVVSVDYKNKIAKYQTPIKDVWLFNYSQIYPYDRGINYAVREANKALELISQKS